jgi:uncharacterized membrane protein affecting hemolysin expression
MCVFYTAACPDEMMANPMTYTNATILLAIFIAFILAYEYFMYRRVKFEVTKFVLFKFVVMSEACHRL